MRLRVRGESMLPSLWPGEVVEIAGCSADDVHPGEIALALRDGRFFLHRFVGRSRADGFLLRGDSMPAPDPEFSSEELLGRVVDCTPPLRPWSRAIGQLFCHCGPARRLVLKLHAARQRDRERQLDATADGLVGSYPMHACGQECPRHTIPISESPNAGA